MNKTKFISLLLLFFTTVFSFPISDYDFHNPINDISTISSSMGGNVLTNPLDEFAFYNNPALLSLNKKNNLSISYRYTPQKDDFYKDLSITKLFSKSQFKAIALQSDKIALAYIPYYDLEQTYKDPSQNIRKDIDYKLSCYQLSYGMKENESSIGFSLKYLTGKLVYLAKTQEDESWKINEFINSEVKGYSLDLSYLLQVNKTTYLGASFYDIVSKLYWEDNPNRVIQKRYGLGLGINGTNNNLNLSISGKINLSENPYYHFGYERKRNLSNKKNTNTYISFRSGCFSKDFQNSENIFFSIGTTFYYNFFKFDISLQNNEWNWNNTIIKSSITMGI